MLNLTFPSMTSHGTPNPGRRRTVACHPSLSFNSFVDAVLRFGGGSSRSGQPSVTGVRVIYDLGPWCKHTERFFNDPPAFLGSPGSSQPGRAVHSWPATQHCQRSLKFHPPPPAATASSLPKTIPPVLPSSNLPDLVETSVSFRVERRPRGRFYRLPFWFWGGEGVCDVTHSNAPIPAEQRCNRPN